MIFDSIMDHFNMFIEMCWSDKFLVTELALMIFDSFMDHFDMSFEDSWVAKFLVTELAWMIFDSFMDRFDMFLEGSWYAKFLVTELALMFDSFMDGFDMSFDFWLDNFLVTNATFKFFCVPRHFFSNSLQILICQIAHVFLISYLLFDAEYFIGTTLRSFSSL